MPTNDQRDGKTPSEKPQPLVEDRSARPISDRGLALAFAALAVALVLGYLLLSKMIDISHQEDCALARRKIVRLAKRHSISVTWWRHTKPSLPG
jgi:hypothetical protein